jgi:hypothetical protein
MRELLANVRDFVLEVGRLATVAGSRPMQIGKAIAAVASLLFGFAADAAVSITVTPAGRVAVTYDVVPFGWMCVLGVFAIWLAAAVATAAVGFKRVVVSDLEFDGSNCRLPVSNRGLFEAEVSVRVISLANTNAEIAMSRLPLELGWMNHPDGRPKLAKGVVYKANVLRIHTARPSNDGSACAYDLCLTGMYDEVMIGRISSAQGDKLLIAVSVDGNTERWYSIEAKSAADGRLKVMGSGPPPLKLLHK